MNSLREFLKGNKAPTNDAAVTGAVKRMTKELEAKDKHDASKDNATSMALVPLANESLTETDKAVIIATPINKAKMSHIRFGSIDSTEPGTGNVGDTDFNSEGMHETPTPLNKQKNKKRSQWKKKKNTRNPRKYTEKQMDDIFNDALARNAAAKKQQAKDQCATGRQAGTNKDLVKPQVSQSEVTNVQDSDHPLTSALPVSESVDVNKIKRQVALGSTNPEGDRPLKDRRNAFAPPKHHPLIVQSVTSSQSMTHPALRPDGPQSHWGMSQPYFAQSHFPGQHLAIPMPSQNAVTDIHPFAQPGMHHEAFHHNHGQHAMPFQYGNSIQDHHFHLQGNAFAAAAATAAAAAQNNMSHHTTQQPQQQPFDNMYHTNMSNARNDNINNHESPMTPRLQDLTHFPSPDNINMRLSQPGPPPTRSPARPQTNSNNMTHTPTTTINPNVSLSNLTSIFGPMSPDTPESTDTPTRPARSADATHTRHRRGESLLNEIERDFEELKGRMERASQVVWERRFGVGEGFEGRQKGEGD